MGVFFDVQNSQEQQKSTLVVFNDLVIDVQTRQVLDAGEKRILTSEEFNTLLLMVQMEGYTLTPLQISQAIQKEQTRVMSIHRIISSLRVKLPKTRFLIETVSGKGYCLKSNQSPCKTAVGYEDFFINSHTRKVFRRGLMIPIRHTEFEILLLFMINPEEDFTMLQIDRHIYDGRHSLSEKDILVNIFSLKEKLRFSGMDYIHSIPEKGYRLQKKVTSKSKGIIVLDSVVFDPYDFIIYIEEEKLDLSHNPTVFKILYQLGKNAELFVAYFRLVDYLKKDNISLTEKNINQRVYNIIKKYPILDDYIQVIKRKGLRWHKKDLSEIRVDEVTIKPVNKTVSIGEETMKLHQSLFEIVHLMAKKPGDIHTQMQILDALYGKGHGVLQGTVRSRVYKIRKQYPKLGKYFQRFFPEEGYCFKTQKNQEIIELPNLTINPNRLKITVDNEKVSMTHKEIQFLHMLAEAKKNHLHVSVSQIIQTLYKSTDIDLNRSIERLALSINKKTGDEYTIVYTKKGYCLDDIYSKTILTDEDVIVLQNLIIDTYRRKVFVNEEEIVFTFIEFDFLHLFAQSPGKFFTTGEIMNYVYGRHDLNPNLIRNHIFYIRKKLKDAHPFIQTILQGDRSKGEQTTRYILFNREIYMEGNMKIDPNRMMLEVNDRMETLIIWEFNIFELLLQNAGLPVSSSRITTEAFKKKVDDKIKWYPYMFDLRIKLKKLGLQDCIETVPNKGYLFNKSCLWQ